MSSSDLTKLPILSAIFKQGAPMTIGITAVFSISLVDTYFVSQLGTVELAALSFSFPISMIVASLSSGLGAGTASIVSRAIGSGNNKNAKRLATDSLVLSCLIIACLSIIGFALSEPLFKLLGASGQALEYVVSYMQIWFISMPFLVIPMVANAIIRSSGNATWPGAIMVISALMNIALTPIFIFGYGPIPAMHIEGAAISTTIARALTFVLAIYVVVFRRNMIALIIPTLSQFAKSSKEILKIALPAGAGSVVNPFCVAVVTSFLATYNETVVAAFGVATRIESFMVIPLLALSAAVGPIVGQNWGAKYKDRVFKTIYNCYALVIVWIVFMTLVVLNYAFDMSSVLASEQDVARISQSYLIAVVLSLIGYGFVIVSSAAFNALGKSVTGLMLYVLRGFVAYIPLTFIASLYFASEWVFYAVAASNAFSGLIISLYTLKWFGKAKAKNCTPDNFTFECK